MDSKQSHLRRSKLARRAAATALIALLAAGLACSRTSDVDVGPLQTVVAATLTAVASAASPTPSPTPLPTSTPGPTAIIFPTEVPPTAVPTASPAASPAQPTANSTDSGGNIPGVVSGGLSYPSEGIPQLAIVFYNQNDGTWWWVGTAANQTSYQMTVPVGTYHIVAYTSSGLAGGYTAAVPCGLTAGCTDHSLLDVNVTSNARVTGINVSDWYAPAGAFPPKPAGVNYP